MSIMPSGAAGCRVSPTDMAAVLGPSSARRTMPGMGVGALLLLVVMGFVSGCSSSHDQARSLPVAKSSSPTEAPFTHAQVLAQVTPTLENGIALLGTPSSSSPSQRLYTVSRPLNTAAAVCIQELAQVRWGGDLAAEEKAFSRALTQIQALTASPPGAAPAAAALYVRRLTLVLSRATASLHSLTDAVNR
jgi:hypothetical protein